MSERDPIELDGWITWRTYVVPIDPSAFHAPGDADMRGLGERIALHRAEQDGMHRPILMDSHGGSYGYGAAENSVTVTVAGYMAKPSDSIETEWTGFGTIRRGPIGWHWSAQAKSTLGSWDASGWTWRKATAERCRDDTLRTLSDLAAVSVGWAPSKGDRA